MTAYATQAQFEAYVEGWTTADVPALTRLLQRASEDLDSILGFYDVYTEGTWAGFKLDPDADLDYAERRALQRATCAQAWYRFEMGEDHFVGPKYVSVTGPEFGTTPPPGNISPLAMSELSGSGLLRNVTSVAAKGRVPSWLSIVRNLD